MQPTLSTREDLEQPSEVRYRDPEELTCTDCGSSNYIVNCNGCEGDCPDEVALCDECKPMTIDSETRCLNCERDWFIELERYDLGLRDAPVLAGDCKACTKPLHRPGKVARYCDLCCQSFCGCCLSEGKCKECVQANLHSRAIESLRLLNRQWPELGKVQDDYARGGLEYLNQETFSLLASGLSGAPLDPIQASRMREFLDDRARLSA